MSLLGVVADQIGRQIGLLRRLCRATSMYHAVVPEQEHVRLPEQTLFLEARRG